MPLTMSRGRTQSLFKYLPEQTYNWQGRAGSFKGTADVDTREMDVPRAWIKRSLLRLLRPFDVAARQAGIGFPGVGVVESGDFELLEPRKFRGDLFPKTFICKACGLFLTLDPGRSAQCSKCGGRGTFEQWSFVELHKCGHLSGLVPAPCRNHCRAPMQLVNRESRAFKEWEWKCSNCGTRAERGVYRGCPQCRNGQVRISRADANPVYHTQYITVVNTPSRVDQTLLDTDTVYTAAVAQALRALPAGLDGLRQAVNDTGTANAEEQTRRQLIEQFGFEPNDPELEMLMRRRREKTSSQSNWADVVDALHLSPEMVTELGHQCVELALAREALPVTIDDLISDSPPALRPMYDISYREVLQRYGFAEATLLREFPLAYIVAGYTRESPTPAPGVNFNFFRGAGGTVAMYGQRMETEALLFRLDPPKVLAWLVKSGVVDDPGDVDAQAWLFSVTQPVPSIFSPPDDRITAAVLGLVHSVAHRTLKAVAVNSGLKTESLSEYLLPHNLAFLIYADTRSEFTLGGLEHVYRNYLAESLEKMDEEYRCVFDPPCRDRDGGGACAVCMFLSENSCERFNTSLSRWYLFGGDDGSIKWQGYWTN